MTQAENKVISDYFHYNTNNPCICEAQGEATRDSFKGSCLWCRTCGLVLHEFGRSGVSCLLEMVKEFSDRKNVKK